MINGSERTATQSAAPSGPVVADGLGPRYARPSIPHLSSARAAVLRTVAAAPDPSTVAVLAERLDQHPNTVREHLDALVADGYVERFRRTPSGRGRPAWLYRAAENADGTGLAAGPLGPDGQEYVALAIALIDQVSAGSPDPRGMARAAGERWGRQLAEQRVAQLTESEATPQDQMVELLRELRFETQSTGDPKTMRLTTCPFLDAAKRHPEVVCQIHLGIVRGAMERLGGDADATDLTAFAQPGACLLNLPDSQ